MPNPKRSKKLPCDNYANVIVNLLRENTVIERKEEVGEMGEEERKEEIGEVFMYVEGAEKEREARVGYGEKGNRKKD